MEQGNYKTLLLKLSGSALGLVVMLFVAVTLGRGLVPDKPAGGSRPDAFTYSGSIDYAENIPSAEVLDLKNSLEEDFKIVVESGKWSAERGLDEARIVLETLKAEQFENLIEIQSSKIEALNVVIEDITTQTAIPSAIKKNIIANLERQLEKTEKKLNKFEDLIVTISYKMIQPLSKHTKSVKCSQEDTEDRTKSAVKAGRKNSIGAFYWI